MYLKNIEIQGFKSFAHKIIFDFHEGITGIVGPNGSGKSNVADAVRWVFGEQKIKQLRGGTMQDVIFSGTELRKPLGFAAVSITLDNSDHQLAIEFEEVTITRKLFRSGESEYAINGATCRLKDLNELFYDTGIGKEGYSIIGQGQIDKILSGKPEDRRELFDEAAGIVKFKKRKNISVKKLEEERQNLTRVNDILTEIEKQLSPLEKQAKTAKIYLEKKEELKVYDINMFLLEAERIKNEITKVEQNIKITQDDYEETNQSYEAMKAEYELAEDEMDVLEEKVEKSRNQLNETNILKQQLESKIALLNEQINTVRTNDEHVGKRALVIQEEIANRIGQKDKLILDLNNTNEALKNEQENVLQIKTQLLEMQSLIQEKTEKIDSLKQGLIQLLNDRSSTKGKIQRFDTMLEQGEVRKSQINRRLIEIESDKLDHQIKMETFEKERANIELKINTFSQDMNQFQNQINELQENLVDQLKKEKDAQSEYHQEKSRLDALKNMTERYDGYGNSIRKVMERKSQVSGLIGVVADLIKTEKKYEIAIETALGGNIQNIVTDHDGTAKQMIQYLKQNKLGRATFLPLSSIKSGQGIRNGEVLKEEGVVGIASSLITIEEKYSNLATYLLGKTLVVSSIDIGIALGKKYQHSLRIVTLEGELLNPGGSITGGAFRNTSNLLGRRREIEDLEVHVKNVHQILTKITAEVEENKESRALLYQKLDAYKLDLQKIKVEENTLAMKIGQIKNKIEEISLQHIEISKENNELVDQNTQIMENVSSIKSELHQSEEEEKHILEQITELQQELEGNKEEETVFLQQNESVQLAFAGAKQRYDFMNQNFQRIEEELLKFQNELEEIEVGKGDTAEEINIRVKEIQEIETTIKDAKELYVEIEAAIADLVKEKEALSLKHKNLINKREEIGKHLSDLDKEIFRLTNKKEGYQEAAEKHMNYMWEEYEITYNYALELRNPELIDLELMRRTTKTLKSDIKALGNVNVNAIEEFKEVSERYIFLKTQHDDLIEAEAILLAIIDELDIAMREQFKAQFELISIEYDRVFKQLFGGGKGTLELIENEDVLEAGVKIIAQPPGKKLQNMMQLSGGEKALTAISLLFAIQNLKPSPFCLLDEIEAALDDSNVVRFANYLHKLKANTQFIVITHRRGTMTASDRLYGITMQEKGVSTLVSVDLLKDELEA